MRNAIARFAALAAAMFAAGASLAGENDVLYWMVDDTASVAERQANGTETSSSVSEFFAAYALSHELAPDSSFAARIRVTGGDISEDTFLGLYSGGGEVVPGDLGIDFDIVGGVWGAGAPDGIQSPSGDYSAGTPEYSFIVELGNIAWDGTGDGTWTTIATSATALYNSLGDYIHERFDIYPGGMAAWTPVQFTAVPEPSGGILSLFGLALLALRRRRTACAANLRGAAALLVATLALSAAGGASAAVWWKGTGVESGDGRNWSSNKVFLDGDNFYF